jgi:hypothetical protein
MLHNNITIHGAKNIKPIMVYPTAYFILLWANCMLESSSGFV